MSQNVTRLKQLLFDDETQTLERLTGRVEQLTALDAATRRDLNLRIDELFHKFGDSERLAESVADVLSDALRRAEVREHAELSISIAPLVVSTIKTELRNSQDEMVEALYPLTGRMVKAYVASAIKDLSNQMNRKLEQNSFMLRLQSLTSGRSVAELAMASAQDFEVRDVYLIRRGTGELLARWPEAAHAAGSAASRDDAMSGVLAAINEFATEALADDGANLRQIDLGDKCLYLRASPLYLLAAHCSGNAPVQIESRIDEAFLRCLENNALHDARFNAGADDDVQWTLPQALSELGKTLQTQVEELQEAPTHSSGNGVLKTLGAMILLPLLFWFAFSLYAGNVENRIRQAVASVIASLPDMRGYPTKLDVSTLGYRMTLSGLAPTDAARDELVRAVRLRLPTTAVDDAIAVVPGPGEPPADLSPDIASLRRDLTSVDTTLTQASLTREIRNARAHLSAATTDIVRSAERSDPADRATLTALATGLNEAAQRLDAINDKMNFDGQSTAIDQNWVTDFNAINGALDQPIQQLEALLATHGADTATAAATVKEIATTAQQAAVESSAASTADVALAELTAASNRVSDLATLYLIKTLTPVPKPPAPLPAPPAPTPQIIVAEPTAREKLTSVVRSKAVFFNNGTDYANSTAADSVLADVSKAIRDAGLLVRVVGYTDETGNSDANLALSLQRANVVRDALVALDVPASLLVVVGRRNGRDIAASGGVNSANRRVEFELGFDGEPGP